MIPLPVALAILLAALMHAGWNVLLKNASDGLLDTVGLAVAASLIAACLLPFVPLPASASWPWMIGTLSVHVAYFLLLAESYRRTDLSLAYPLMRGTAPLLVAAASPILGEPANAGLLLGVACVGTGILLPTAAGIWSGGVRGSALLFALANSLVIALYTIFDGLGVRAAGNPLSYILWLFFLNAWAILAVVCWHRGRGVFGHLRRRWAHHLLGAAMSIGSYGIVLWAMTVAPLAAVAALRETSVVFAAIFGAALLKESMGLYRILGACAVGLGIIIVKVQP